jgi:hypothetical protein
MQQSKGETMKKEKTKTVTYVIPILPKNTTTMKELCRVIITKEGSASDALLKHMIR